jgi:NitT/TauT family transport system permease protein/taurine transport system permease protein
MKKRVLRRLVMFVALLVVWELAFRAHLLNPLIFGSPTLIADAVVKDGWTFFEALQVTTAEVVIAIIVAWTLGIGFGVLAGSVPFLSRAFTPFLSGLIAIPFVVLYPVLIAWLGIGPPSKIVFGILLGTFPIALSTAVGVQTIDSGYTVMVTAMGASRSQRIFRVMVPLALPAVLSGLRLGTSLVISGVVLTEMLASTGGLGFWITYNRSLFNTGQVYLGISLALLLTAVTNVVLMMFERKFGRWRTLQQAVS